MDDTRTAKLKPVTSEGERTIVTDLNETLIGSIDATDEATRVDEGGIDGGVRSNEATRRTTTTTNNAQTGTLDVGRSADLYASVVLQKLPQVRTDYIASNAFSDFPSVTSNFTFRR